jgi:uncharacterized protein (TIGR02466 family)
MINNLFATPVLTEVYENPNFLNAALLQEAKGNYGFELFDLNTQAVNTLKHWIKGHVDDMAKQYGFRYSKLTGRQNVIKPLESDTPHHHVGKSILVGVYYADVPPNSGDILLHDPRGPLPWENLNFNPNDPIANKSARCYHRVKPQNGLLLLFPGFLVHSVETNLSNQNRTSIVLNAHY